jgi:hypothetical protein
MHSKASSQIHERLSAVQLPRQLDSHQATEESSFKATAMVLEQA